MGMKAKVKRFDMSDLRYRNETYFAKGNDKFFGVVGRKLVVSAHDNRQYMIERHVKRDLDMDKYTVRPISSDGKVGTPKSYNTIGDVSQFLGKRIKA